jgi:hypothetical protein
MILGIGLQDGLNPCIFMTCTVFIVYGSWFKRRFQGIFWSRFIFVLVYVLCNLLFNFGPVQVLIFNKYFMFSARVLYFFLGGWAFILGILFLKDWFFLIRGQPLKGLGDEKIKSFKGGLGLALLIASILPVVLSALATIWPINTYFMILGNEAILRGQWHMVASLLAGYIFCSMWPLWLVWAFLSIKDFRPSLFMIICASIFFYSISMHGFYI